MIAKLFLTFSCLGEDRHSLAMEEKIIFPYSYLIFRMSPEEASQTPW